MEWLAQHARRGEMWEKAVTYAQQAGALAVAHGAYRQAAALFEAALAAVAHLPQNRETQALSVDLMLVLRLELYREAVARFGSTPTLIEWDNRIPELSVLLVEASRAEAVARSVFPTNADLAC